MPANQTENDNEIEGLISKIARGCESALSKLYDKTSGLVYGLIRKMLSENEEAEEVALDVYMQIWNNAVTYKSDKSKPLTWIMMMTRSRSIDKLRSGSKRRTLEKPLYDSVLDTSNNPESDSLESQNKVIIKNALSQLNDNERTAIELAYFHGYTQSEIAAEMNHPLGTVKSWIRIGMKKLRSIIIKNKS